MDVLKIKGNIQKMIDQGAPESDIDLYLSQEGVTAEQLRGAPKTPAFGNQMAQPQGDVVEGPNALERFGKGAKDVIDAGAQLLTHTLPDAAIDLGNRMTPFAKMSPDPVVGPLARGMDIQPMTMEQVDQDIAQSNATYESNRQAGGQTGLDVARLGGSVAATLPLAMQLPAASTLKGSFATGAAGGGLFGALSPVTDPGQQKDFWKKKGEQVGISAGLAGPLSAATGAISKVLAPQVDKSVQYLIDKGVIPTMGQIQGGALGALENKLTSVPLLGDMIKNAQRRTVEDFNKAVLNDVLKPIGKSVTAVGREGVEQAEDALSGAYQSLLPKLSFQADGILKAELAKIAQMAKEMPEPQLKQFVSVVKNKVASRLSANGTMDGQTFKGVESELGHMIKGYMKDPSFDQRQLGAAIESVRSALRQTLTRGNPQYASELSTINGAWAKFAKVRDAASRIGSQEGIFTPAQMQAAVRAGDNSVGKGKFAKGEALMQDLSEAGKKVITSYPDSGTAGRTATGLLGLGGVGYVDPTAAAALTAFMAPYTKMGQKAAMAALTKRPDVVKKAGELLMKASPGIGATAGALGGLLD